MAFLQNKKCLWKLIFFFAIVLCSSVTANSQQALDSLLNKINPDKWSALISRKADKLQDQLVKKSQQTLNRLQKQEEKIYCKMLRGKDSVQAQAQLVQIREKYQAMRDKLSSPSSVANGSYIPKLDTITSSLNFLDKYSVGGNVKQALQKTTALQDKFSQSEAIKQFIRERRELLKAKLQELGLVKDLKKFNKEVYYYSQQLNEWKETFKDSKKIERKAIEILSKTKIFKDFLRKNSQLASLFRLPGDPNDPSSQVSLAGLQTRAQVNGLIQQQLAAGGPMGQQQFSQNLQSAQSQLDQLKNKFLKGGGGNSDDIMPEGFKPNNQKTKSFLQRLEYGSNIQTQKASNYFPVTSDIGLSIGYKLNAKSIIGIGASYKLGWGNSWRDISITSQGIGLRSFAEIKLKKSLWIAGGFEQNYRTGFSNFDQLRDYSQWQRSGLLGLSKVVSVKMKFFKKTKLQLLWDFLSYDQIPRTQPLVFRVGYNF
jgi:hypothetical protein